MGSLPNLHELEGKAELETTPICTKQCEHAKLKNRHAVNRHVASSFHEGKRVPAQYTHCNFAKFGRTSQRTSKPPLEDTINERVAACSSPDSNHSTKILTQSMRRKESINSSIGATSIRRLITVQAIPYHPANRVYLRRLRLLLKYLILFCVASVLMNAAFIPFLILQGAMSVWVLPNSTSYVPLTTNTGALCLVLLYTSAAISVLISPCFLSKNCSKFIFVAMHGSLCVFFLLHLYPSVYILAGLYLLLGVLLGPYYLSRVNFLMTFSYTLLRIHPDENEFAASTRKTAIIRRVGRALQLAQDFGLKLGSALTFAMIAYMYNYGRIHGETVCKNFRDNCTAGDCRTVCCPANQSSCSRSFADIFDTDAFWDDFFDKDEFGFRLCGSQACPSTFVISRKNFPVPESISIVVIINLAVLCSIALILSGAGLAGLEKMRAYLPRDHLKKLKGHATLRTVKMSFKDVKLLSVAPLSMFVGLEQAFMYVDFSKSFVVCSLGIRPITLVFLSMGLLQSIAACTLSMFLKSIRRRYVVGVGFLFHSCLLMVQIIWKPISDDSALLYVISAAWGVCNAIWEVLIFSVLSEVYAHNWEVPFANTIFFRLFGFAVAFSIHAFFCNLVKLYFLFIFMIISLILFVWLDVYLENMKKGGRMNKF